MALFVLPTLPDSELLLVLQKMEKDGHPKFKCAKEWYHIKKTRQFPDWYRRGFSFNRWGWLHQREHVSNVNSTVVGEYMVAKGFQVHAGKEFEITLEYVTWSIRNYPRTIPNLIPFAKANNDALKIVPILEEAVKKGIEINVNHLDMVHFELTLTMPIAQRFEKLGYKFHQIWNKDAYSQIHLYPFETIRWYVEDYCQRFPRNRDEMQLRNLATCTDIKFHTYLESHGFYDWIKIIRKEKDTDDLDIWGCAYYTGDIDLLDFMLIKKFEHPEKIPSEVMECTPTSSNWSVVNWVWINIFNKNPDRLPELFIRRQNNSNVGDWAYHLYCRLKGNPSFEAIENARHETYARIWHSDRTLEPWIPITNANIYM